MACLLGATLAAAALALGVRQARAGDRSAARIELRNEKITLPFGTEFFQGGPKAEKANERCLLCHSRDMVDTQPLLSLDTWKAEVNKMHAVYGCPVLPNEVDGLAQFMFELNHQPAR